MALAFPSLLALLFVAREYWGNGAALVVVGALFLDAVAARLLAMQLLREACPRCGARFAAASALNALQLPAMAFARRCGNCAVALHAEHRQRT